MDQDKRDVLSTIRRIAANYLSDCFYIFLRKRRITSKLVFCEQSNFYSFFTHSAISHAPSERSQCGISLPFGYSSGRISVSSRLALIAAQNLFQGLGQRHRTE